MLHKEPDGSYKIPRIIYADAYASEMVAYADLVLPDTTYLERWDCISLLDRPIGSALALTTGALWLNALLLLWEQPNAGIAILALLAIALAAWLKDRYWRFIDNTAAPSTPETAIGLLGRGRVSALDRPHTEQNYLLREMGFAIARKHAQKLRRLTLILGFAAPLLLTLFAALLPGKLATLAGVLAALSVMAGMLAERWLFFAEARHTVTLYYGASTV